MPRSRGDDWQPDGLTRWERALNIDRDDVEWQRTGIWSVQSSTCMVSYRVVRQVYYCQQKGCADNGRPCQHRYSCSCPDEENPCKHVYRVWMLDRDPYPPPPVVSEPVERVAVRRQHVVDLGSRMAGLLQDPRMDVYVASDLLMHLRELDSRSDAAANPHHYESDTSASEEETVDSDDDSSSQGNNHRCRRRRLDDATEKGYAGTAGAERRRANSIPGHQVQRVGTAGPPPQQSAMWRVDGAIVTRHRCFCKRRACQVRARTDPCRHRYRCTCQGRSPPTAPCKHALRVATLDYDEYPATPDVEQEARCRRDAASDILSSLLAAASSFSVAAARSAKRLDVLELGLWRAVRYALTSLADVHEDALAGLQLSPSTCEDGSEHRCPGCWVVLGRAECARLIPGASVVAEDDADGAADGPAWRVQGHRVARLKIGPCPRVECVRLFGAHACEHLYRCGCVDTRNPCRHVLRVAAMECAAQIKVPAAAQEAVPPEVEPAVAVAASQPEAPSPDVKVVAIVRAELPVPAMGLGAPPSRKRKALEDALFQVQAFEQGPAGNTRRQRAAARPELPSKLAEGNQEGSG